VKRIRLTVISALALVLLAGSPGATAAAKENVTTSPNNPTSSQLVVDSKEWDGKTVTFTGEAIADAQERGDFAWIHLNDDAYYLKNVEEGAGLGGFNSGQAVWLPLPLAEKIAIFGDYTHEGDVVRVSGTFNAACGQHGGDMDIHATALEVVTPGHEFREPVQLDKLGLAAILMILAAVLWYLNRRTTQLETFGSLATRKR